MAYADYSAGTGASGFSPSGGGAADETDDFSVEKLQQQYRDFLDNKDEELREQRLSRHYFHGDQLTPAELRILKARKQPAVVRNKIRRKVNAVVGLLERLRQDPKAFPRTPTEPPPEAAGNAPGGPSGPGMQPGGPGMQPGPLGRPPGAAGTTLAGNEPPPLAQLAAGAAQLKEDSPDIATGAIRYVLDKPNNDNADWATTAAECARDGLINGIYGIEFELVFGDRGDPDLSFGIVDSESFFYDARSIRYGFNDARFMGTAKWVDLDLAQELFPDHADELKDLVQTGTNFGSVQHEDREISWVSRRDKRVFLVEHWYLRRGDWWVCYYVADLILRRAKSDFYDELGRTVPRYVMGSVNIDHDGDRYGVVRELKSLQDEVNARASKALHILNTRRVKLTRGAVDDIELLRREAVRPDGVIEINPGGELEFDDLAKAQEMTGHLEFLAEVKSELENFGPNPAVIGEGLENKSGRAIALLQQAGIAELGPMILGYRGWKLRVYRMIWNTIERYWTAERWIRITDNDGLAQFFKINKLKVNDWGEPILVNALGQLDVDIVLDEGPDTITMMMDTYDTLLALAQQGLDVPPEILLELAPIDAATKRRLRAKMAAAKAPDPRAAALQMGKLGAEIQGRQARAKKDTADAALTVSQIPGAKAKAAKDRAGAVKDVVDAAVTAHTHHSGLDLATPQEEATPADGGINQFAPGPPPPPDAGVPPAPPGA